MANFIVSYDLNGPTPSHKTVDEVFQNLGAVRARILETVWYVGWGGTPSQLLDHLKSVLSSDDLLFVVEAKDATWTALLVDDASLQSAWNSNR